MRSRSETYCARGTTPGVIAFAGHLVVGTAAAWTSSAARAGVGASDTTTVPRMAASTTVANDLDRVSVATRIGDILTPKPRMS